jgi:hypothetical protein
MIAASSTGDVTRTFELDVQGDARLDLMMVPPPPDGR